MPWSALPEHLNSPEKWRGTDNDVWWMRWEIATKGWWAFGPRAKEWWGRWREIPKVLFAVGGRGPWRWEYTDGTRPEIYDYNANPKTGGMISNYVLSRVQYYKRWHIMVQWPLQVTFHVYWNLADVPTTGERPGNLEIKKLLFLYGPVHRDTDLVYWLLSFYIGGQWK